MNVNYLKVMVAVTAAILFSGISARAAETVQADVRQVSGEITWVDTNAGLLQIKDRRYPNTAEVAEFRITEHETRVTDPSDQKFFSVKDLQPGQYVTVDVVKGKEENIVQKIVAEPLPVSDRQVALGHLQAIDFTAGTLVLEERPRIGEEGTVHLSSFVFEPNGLVVLQSPSMQPVQLTLNPGDVVKVEYVVIGGKRWARSITLYSPRGTTTTTTTTVTTTQ